eukprot:TRINITY_DN5919_c0_g1_i1.p1 TRINITY_DN5919_c0_g1~~TRINITY_DN5919_c0_g1_i1.p1  ORF type:complete len:1032 (-),score=121.44 TRINITY_DN5919_c0_g1_i1:104-3199(-)
MQGDERFIVFIFFLPFIVAGTLDDCTSVPDYCVGGTCIVYSEIGSSYCSCSSGIMGSHCNQSITSDCDAYFSHVLSTSSSTPVTVSASMNNSTLTLRIYSSLVKERLYSLLSISNLLKNPNCTYPGVYWRKEFDTVRCMDVFVCEMPWVDSFLQCGWTEDDSDPEFYLFLTNLTLLNYDSLAYAFGNRPGTQNLKRTSQTSIPIVVQFKRVVEMSSQFNVRIETPIEPSPVPSPNPSAGFNLIWWDENGDGILDNEKPVAGIIVQLFQTDDWSITIAETITDSNGHYYFGNIQLTGRYDLVINYTRNRLDPKITYASTNSSNSIIKTVDEGNFVVMTQIVLKNQMVTNYSIGLFNLTSPLPSSTNILNSVWIDSNTNGIRDDDEVGIPNVLIALLESHRTESMRAIDFVITDESGYFNFSNVNILNPNTYYFVRLDFVTNSLPFSLGVSPTQMAGGNQANLFYTLSGEKYAQVDVFVYDSLAIDNIGFALVNETIITSPTPLTNEFKIIGAITKQEVDPEGALATIEIVSIIPYPYFLYNYQLNSFPSLKSNYSTSDISDPASCENLDYCTQTFRLSIITNGACTISGNYSFAATIGCKSDQGNCDTQSYFNGRKAHFDASLWSENFCAKVGVLIGTDGILKSYASDSYNMGYEEDIFLVDEVAYFKIFVESNKATIKNTNITHVKLKPQTSNSSSIVLYRSGEVVYPSSNFTLDQSAATFSFVLNQSFLPTPFNLSYTVSATVIVTYDGVTKKRVVVSSDLNRALGYASGIRIVTDPSLKVFFTSSPTSRIAPTDVSPSDPTFTKTMEIAIYGSSVGGGVLAAVMIVIISLVVWMLKRARKGIRLNRIDSVKNLRQNSVRAFTRGISPNVKRMSGSRPPRGNNIRNASMDHSSYLHSATHLLEDEGASIEHEDTKKTSNQKDDVIPEKEGNVENNDADEDHTHDEEDEEEEEKISELKKKISKKIQQIQNMQFGKNSSSQNRLVPTNTLQCSLPSLPTNTPMNSSLTPPVRRVMRARTAPALKYQKANMY